MYLSPVAIAANELKVFEGNAPYVQVLARQGTTPGQVMRTDTDHFLVCDTEMATVSEIVVMAHHRVLTGTGWDAPEDRISYRPIRCDQ